MLEIKQNEVFQLTIALMLSCLYPWLDHWLRFDNV